MFCPTTFHKNDEKITIRHTDNAFDHSSSATLQTDQVVRCATVIVLTLSMNKLTHAVTHSLNSYPSTAHISDLATGQLLVL